MLKILLAVDGSDAALRATDAVVTAAGLLREPLQVELVTVTTRVPTAHPLAAAALPQQAIDEYYQAQGEQALAAARQTLQVAGIACTACALVGQVAQTLVEHADRTQCDMIWMGSRGLAPLSSFMLGSVATRVLALAKVPVTLVP
jgi:nucleotide-binding universal stress UspA family protein